jgi:hypothetical protein
MRELSWLDAEAKKFRPGEAKARQAKWVTPDDSGQ